MNKVLVYHKSKDLKEFLVDFFKKEGEYSPTFVSSIRRLKSSLKNNHFDALLIDASLIDAELKKEDISIPKIALISENIPHGLKEVVSCNIDCYLIAPFYPEDLQLKLKTVIERKSWFKRLYSEKKDLEAIVELTYLISSTLDPREILYFIVKKLSEMIEVTRCSILSIGFGDKRYAYVVSSFEDPSIRNIKLDLKKYPEIREALKTRKPVIINDALKHPLMKPVLRFIMPLRIKSIVVIPIIHRDEIIGTLFLRTSRVKDGFNEREIRLCNAVANVSANSLYNAFMFEKLENEKARLEKLAITDYLTGIYNIRYFYHRLEEEFSRAQRYGYPLCCIMLDIDHFKKINDKYGHRVGDLVLREFAQLIRRHTRRSDVFARYGGEEFILLLPQTSLDGAEKEAKRLSAFVREHRFKIIGNEKITTSMGIACWPVHKVENPDDLITLADNALFKAKNKGRDRIEISSTKR